jgi:hypothetical protein
MLRVSCVQASMRNSLSFRQIITAKEMITAAAMATLFVLDWQWSVEEARMQETGIVTD